MPLPHRRQLQKTRPMFSGVVTSNGRMMMAAPMSGRSLSTRLHRFVPAPCNGQMTMVQTGRISVLRDRLSASASIPCSMIWHRVDCASVLSRITIPMASLLLICLHSSSPSLTRPVSPVTVPISRFLSPRSMIWRASASAAVVVF